MRLLTYVGLLATLLLAHSCGKALAQGAPVGDFGGTLQRNLTVNGDAGVAGNLGVTGSTSVAAITATGTATLAGVTGTTGDFTGQATADSARVAGQTTFGKVAVDGGMTVSGTSQFYAQVTNAASENYSATTGVIVTLNSSNAAALTLASTGGISTSGPWRGSKAILVAGALVTCAAGTEGTLMIDTLSGGTSTGKHTRFCACISDGAASPVFYWINLDNAVSAGTTTTCPDDLL